MVAKHADLCADVRDVPVQRLNHPRQHAAQEFGAGLFSFVDEEYWQVPAYRQSYAGPAKAGHYALMPG